MYERFTERAKKVLELAQQEAQRLNHEYIGTEHVLLGLVKEGSGVAANVLRNMNVDLKKIRLEVEKIVQKGPDLVYQGKMPQTPRTKKVIEHAMEESRSAGHNYVGTEHILLGLLHEREAVSARVLMNLGLKLDHVRQEVLNLLGLGPVAEKEPEPAPSAAEPEEAEVYTVAVPPPALPWPDWVREAVTAPQGSDIELRLARLRVAKRAAAGREDYETAIRLRDDERALRAASSRQASLALLLVLLSRPEDPAYMALAEAGLDIDGVRKKIRALLNEGVEAD